MKIKICGVTQLDDAARVGAAGVDFIGLNFWPRSKRCVDLDRAAAIAAVVRAAGAAQLVGVFVDATADEVAAVMAHVDLDLIQLHGDETPHDVMAVANAARRPVWKAIAAGAPGDVAHLEAWPADAILLDAPSAGKGGAGVAFDWSLACDARARFPARRLVLAGGLRADNVGAAIAAVQPWGVDVASGVESAPGVKDADKVAAFVAAVRAASA